MKKSCAVMLTVCLAAAMTACGGNSLQKDSHVIQTEEEKGAEAAAQSMESENFVDESSDTAESSETVESGEIAETAADSDVPVYERASVRVAYMPNMGSGSTLITAQQMGIFDEYGLDVTLTQFQNGPVEIAAMASGDIDIAQIGHGAHALCIEGEALIFAIDCLGVSDVVMVNTEHGINTVEDLKGKTVAVSTGTSSELILNLALQQAGIGKEELELVEMDVQGMVTAMVAGQIDGCATWDPSSTTIEKQMGDKVKTIAGNYDFMDVATFPGSFITTDSYQKENRDVLIRFGAALLKAQEYRAAHIEEVCEWLAAEVEADPDTILATKESADWLTPAVISDRLLDGTVKGWYEAQQQVFLDSGRIPERVDTEQYILYDVMDECMTLYNNMQ